MKREITLKTRRVIDDSCAWHHYNLGKTDAEIAAACGVHKNTVANWRKRHMLSARVPQKQKKEAQPQHAKKERILTPLERDAVAAREAGLTYGKYKARQYIEQMRAKERLDERLRKREGR